MKKYTLLCVGLCAAMAFTSCKSSESAYKKAYEKAKQQELWEEGRVNPQTFCTHYILFYILDELISQHFVHSAATFCKILLPFPPSTSLAGYHVL